MYLNERNKTGSSEVTVISSGEDNFVNEKGADVRGGGGGCWGGWKGLLTK